MKEAKQVEARQRHWSSLLALELSPVYALAPVMTSTQPDTAKQLSR